MIYLDNAATTLYKPPEVGQAMLDALQTAGNPGRGAHAPTLHASRIVYETREALARLFHAEGPACIAFASNATQALNTAINGLFGPGDHVITTVCEHNSVLRPLYRLQRQGVEVSFVDVDANGVLCYAQFEQLLRPNTRGVVVTGASNVTGNVLDLSLIKAFCQRHHLGLIVDVSQTAGAIDVDLSDGIVTAVCFTGHKSLYGPGGTGGIVIRRDALVTPYITGGDGVHSFEREQPSAVPGVFEAGTANVAGIAGLDAGIKQLLDGGVAAAAAHQEALARIFVPAVQAIPGIRLYGDFSGPRVGVYSLNIGDAESAVVSDILWQTYQMATRPAYHCAPLIHQALGTAVQGAVRFSFSQFTTADDVRAAVRALRAIAAM